MKIEKEILDVDFVKRWMKYGINPIILSILNRRNINDDLELYKFFNINELGALPSSFLFSDIEKAYMRLERAISEGERILIFGDRDVDGVTSVNILINFLKKVGAIFDYIVPLRDEPYGLEIEKVKSWAGKYGLLITVDCGITNVGEIAFLKDSGIDTIIIDHHYVQDNIPDAYSIIHCKYNFESIFDMAACYVTFIFCYGYFFWKSDFYNKIYSVSYKNRKYYLKNLKWLEIDFSENYIKNNIKNFQIVDITNSLLEYEKVKKALIYNNEEIFKEAVLTSYKSTIIDKIEKMKSFIEENIAYAMLGTISDIMPLVSYNRVVVNLGIKNIKERKNKLFITLLEKVGLDIDHFNAIDISWKISPILNSPGRLGDAMVSIEYLQSNDINILERILEINKERKKQGEDAYNLFINEIESNASLFGGKLNLFYSEDICKGVIGITASKLAEISNRPVIVCAVDENYVVGSVRGDTDIHFVEFLDGAKEILEEFGGHKFAAGFRMKKEKFEEFRNFLLRNALLFTDKYIEQEESYKVDAEIPFKYLNCSLYNTLSLLEPFGEQNERPILWTGKVKIENYSVIGKDRNHLRFTLVNGNDVMQCIAFNKALWFLENHKEENLYDIVYKVELNNFKGNINIQLKILEMDISSS